MNLFKFGFNFEGFMTVPATSVIRYLTICFSTNGALSLHIIYISIVV